MQLEMGKGGSGFGGVRSTEASRAARKVGRHVLGALAALCIVVIVVPTPAHGAYRISSGNLRSYLTGICIPGAGTQVFEEPSASDLADWDQVIEDLIDGNLGQAVDLADWLLYDLVEFTDTATGCVYYVLVEQLCDGGIGCPSGFLQWDPEPCRGLGTYVYNPHSRRALNIQSPHALTDGATWPESVAMFFDLQATFLQVAGVRREWKAGWRELLCR